MSSLEELRIDYTEEDVKRFATYFYQAVRIIDLDELLAVSFLTVTPDKVKFEVHVIEKLDEIKDIVDFERMVTPVLGITDPIGQLQKWLAETLTEFAKALINLFRPIIEGAQYFIVNTLLSAITGLGNAISGFVNTVVTYIANSLQNFYSAIQNFFTTQIGNLMKYIGDAFANFSKTIWENLSRIGEVIVKSFTEFASRIQEFFTRTLPTFFEPITRALTSIGSFIQQIPSIIQQALGNVLATISTQLARFGEALINIFTRLQSFFAETLPKFAGQITEGIGRLFSDFASRVTDFFQRAFTSLSESLRGFISQVVDAFRKVGDALTQVGAVITGFVNAILRFPEWFPRWFTENIAKPIVEGFRALADWIWKMIPDWLKSGLESIGNFFKTLWESLRDFFTKTLPKFFTEDLPRFFTQDIPNFFKSLGERIYEGLKNFASLIWENLPNWVKDTLQAIGDVFKPLKYFFDWLWNTIQDFIKDPVKWVKTNIVDKIREGIRLEDIVNGIGNFILKLIDFFKPLANKVFEGLQFLIQIFSQLAEKFIEFIIDVSKHISNFLAKIFSTLYNWGQTIATPFIEFFKKVYESLANILRPSIARLFGDLAVRARGEIRAFIIILIGLGLMGALSFLVPRLLKALSSTLRTKSFTFTIPGISTTVTIKWGALLYEFADAIEKMPAYLTEAFAISSMFYFLEVWRYYFRGLWKGFFHITGLGDLPIEMPWIEYSIEVLRRYGIENEVAWLKDILWKRGYPNWFNERFTATVSEAYVPVKDRFGNTRLVPLSPLYVQPTVHDLARFMIRDMFGTGSAPIKVPVLTYEKEKIEIEGVEYEIPVVKRKIETKTIEYKHPYEVFKEWTRRLGLHEDTAVFFYLLHFKYPSPEKLWEFLCRGIAGLLWYVPTKDEENEASGEAKQVGAGIPIAPYELNYKFNELFTAFSTYMKWHDYAKFSWFTPEQHKISFTSDNWLIIDVLADIPTKIDQRWMIKWGLYELMSKSANITPTQPVEAKLRDIVTKVLEDQAKSKVTLDLKLFCHTLQATGLHPDWVPVTAVAEAMNMLTEERTLLRTGFLNLFKEGFWDVKALETLLERFVVASFYVEWFDIESRKWIPKVINVPVMFLPAERKLLELRALMDRALDILRDFSKDITLAYAENIVVTYDEYKNRLQEVIKSINDWFAQDYKAITGVDLPKEMYLQLVDVYWKSYSYIASLLRDIYATRRVRYWFARLIAWTLYRIAYGYVKIEEAEKLIEEIKEQAKLTDQEAKAIKTVARRLLEFVAREEIPTPSQLATIVEVVPEAIKFVDKVLEARRVPIEWREVWRKYIEHRPLYDELRTLRSTLITAYARGYITEAELSEGFSILKTYGWTDKELEILKKIAEIRRKYYEAREAIREYIPTPTMFVTLLEYVPEIAPKFIEVMQKRNVPPDWVEYWKLYAERRIIYTELRPVITRVIHLYSYGFINNEWIKKFFDYLSKLGYTKEELELLYRQMRLYKDEHILERIIPSPVALTGYARYTLLAKDLLNFKLGAILDIDALKEIYPEDLARKLVDTIRKFYDQMLIARTAYPDVRGYVNDLLRAYEYGAIGDKELEAELNFLKQFGLSDINIEIIRRRAKVRRTTRVAIRGY